MKITKSQLQQIIKEELNEVTVTHSDREDWTKRRPDESGRDFMRRMSYEKQMRADNRQKVLDELTNMLGTDTGRYMDALKFFVMRANQEDLDEFMTGTGLAGYPGA
jgi:hypothetical protein